MAQLNFSMPSSYLKKNKKTDIKNGWNPSSTWFLTNFFQDIRLLCYVLYQRLIQVIRMFACSQIDVARFKPCVQNSLHSRSFNVSSINRFVTLSIFLILCIDSNVLACPRRRADGPLEDVVVGGGRSGGARRGPGRRVRSARVAPGGRRARTGRRACALLPRAVRAAALLEGENLQWVLPARYSTYCF